MLGSVSSIGPEPGTPLVVCDGDYLNWWPRAVNEAVRTFMGEDESTATVAVHRPTLRGLGHGCNGGLQLQEEAACRQGATFGIPVARLRGVGYRSVEPQRLIRTH